MPASSLSTHSSAHAQVALEALLDLPARTVFAREAAIGVDRQRRLFGGRRGAPKRPKASAAAKIWEMRNIDSLLPDAWETPEAAEGEVREGMSGEASISVPPPA